MNTKSSFLTKWHGEYAIAHGILVAISLMFLGTIWRGAPQPININDSFITEYIAAQIWVVVYGACFGIVIGGVLGGTTIILNFFHQRPFYNAAKPLMFIFSCICAICLEIKLVGIIGFLGIATFIGITALILTNHRPILPMYLIALIMAIVWLILSIQAPVGRNLYYSKKDGQLCQSILFVARGFTTIDEEYFVVPELPLLATTVKAYTLPSSGAGWESDIFGDVLNARVGFRITAKNHQAYEIIANTKLPAIAIRIETKSETAHTLKSKVLELLKINPEAIVEMGISELSENKEG